MEHKVEFIPASELPVAEGNEVEMLVVENGELKRKEADSGVKTVNGIEPDENGDVEVSSGVRTVNGIEPDDNGNVEVSSGNEPDMIIEFVGDSVSYNGKIVSNDITITKGSVKDVVTALSEGRRPVVKIVCHHPLVDESDYAVFLHETNASVHKYGNSLYITFINVPYYPFDKIYRHLMTFHDASDELASIETYEITLTKAE